MKLLKFEASWCNPCKQLTKTMETIDFPFPVEVIDIDANRDAALEHGVRGVPLLLLKDENENIILRLSGAQTKSQIEAAFEPYM